MIEKPIILIPNYKIKILARNSSITMTAKLSFMPWCKSIYKSYEKCYVVKDTNLSLGVILFSILTLSTTGPIYPNNNIKQLFKTLFYVVLSMKIDTASWSRNVNCCDGHRIIYTLPLCPPPPKKTWNRGDIDDIGVQVEYCPRLLDSPMNREDPSTALLAIINKYGVQISQLSWLYQELFDVSVNKIVL